MKWFLLAVLLAALLYFLWSSQQQDASSSSNSIWPLDWANDSGGSGSDTPDASDPIGEVISNVSDAISSGIDAITGGAMDGVVRIWADAIQKHEGYFPGSRSYRNNNPGNIRGTGDAGSDPQGFRIYSTYALGREALEADLRAKLRKYPSYTIAEIMARYAPASDNNNVTAYAQAVADALGVSTATTLAELVG